MILQLVKYELSPKVQAWKMSKHLHKILVQSETYQKCVTFDKTKSATKQRKM